MRERKKIEINAFGKTITIDEPEKIRIMFKGRKAFIFDLDINEPKLDNLQRAFRNVKRR